MRTLHHLPFSASCRIVRICLAEKSLTIDRLMTPDAHDEAGIVALNPAGQVPVLVEPDGTTLTDRYTITEYLEEVYPKANLLGADPVTRSETRRLVNWFDVKFAAEVTDKLVGEKILKRFSGAGGPNSDAIRLGRDNINYHLDYVGYLYTHRNWIGGDDISLADIAAAAHLSAIDYLGDVPWGDHPEAKDWYVRIKSRPSFRSLLEDRLPGIRPVAHYADLDF